MARIMDPVAATKRKSLDVEAESDGEDAPLQPLKRVKKERREASQSIRTARLASQQKDPEADSDTSTMYSSEDDEESDDEDVNLDRYDDDAKMAAYERSLLQGQQYAVEICQAGYVKSVTLIDFMCHRNTTLDFGAQMNFLVGHNGSGKSAVLTAIAIALGGSTAMTGRGQGIKDLIRKGAEKAVITVTLANEGDNAYRPDVYLKNIIVERSITKSSAPYSFRATKDGKIVANKKEELSRILDHFGIHVDSPLTILTQDRARSFLQSSDPSSLYKFFLQGTLLQDLSDHYDGFNLSAEKLEHYRDQEEEKIPILQANFDRLLRQQKAHERLLQMRAQLDEIARELAWAYVIQKERELQEAIDKVERQLQKIEQANQRIANANADVQTAGGQIEALQKQIQDLNESEAPFTAQRDSLRKKLELAKKEILNIADECKACQSSIAECGREVELYDERIREQEEASRGTDPAIAKLRKDIDDHLQLISNLRRQKPKTESDLQEAVKALEQAEAKEDTLQNEAMEAQRLASEHSTVIENLKMQAKNRITAFGDRMELVMREVERAPWRHSKPIGPLGMHVKLLDMRYQKAFQRVMGSTLCQFAVRCEEDRRTMTDILQRCQRQGYRSGHTRGRAAPSVIQHAGERFDYASGDLSHLNETILSKLEFDNEDVKRILINAHGIERTFVWPQISGATGVNQRIRELLREGQQSCVFVTADGFNARGTKETEQSGPLPTYDGNILLTKDAATNIESLRSEHAVLLNKATEAKTRHSETIAEKSAAGKRKADTITRLEKVTSGVRRAEEKVERFRNELADKEIVDQGEDLAGAREEAMRRRRGAEEQLVGMQEQRERFVATKDELETRVSDVQAELDKLAPERTKTSEALTVLAQNRSKAVQDGEYYKRSVSRYGDHLKVFEQERELCKNTVADWTVSATAQRGRNRARIETTRTPAELDQQHSAMAAAIKKSEEDRGVSVQDITVKVSDAQKRYETKVHDVLELTKIVKLCCSIVKNRRDFWTAERMRLSIQANCVFITASDKRDLTGVLDFDHNQRKLYIQVKEQGLHTQGISASYKTPQTMSGGERSFITVSLLLSMWALVSCPIRCLDEWDVFLDHANRKVAANMLLEGARGSSDVQHLLITPQDMSGINVTGQNSKVIKMADPIRNQGTLPF